MPMEEEYELIPMNPIRRIEKRMERIESAGTSTDVIKELIDITNETALKVTVARWLTPNGSSISEMGLEPDVTVEITEEDIESNRDPQLDKAIEMLNGKS